MILKKTHKYGYRWPIIYEEFVAHFYLFAWMLNVLSYGLMAINRYVAIVYSMYYSTWFRQVP